MLQWHVDTISFRWAISSYEDIFDFKTINCSRAILSCAFEEKKVQEQISLWMLCNCLCSNTNKLFEIGSCTVMDLSFNQNIFLAT